MCKCRTDIAVGFLRRPASTMFIDIACFGLLEILGSLSSLTLHLLMKSLLGKQKHASVH